MTATTRSGDGVRWLPGPRSRRLRCSLLGGHRWSGSPSSSGVTIAVCGRCGELVVVPFVDVAVFGLHPGSPSPLGPAAVARSVLDLLSAVLAGDQVAAAEHRSAAVAAPGAAVDALVAVALVLAGRGMDTAAAVDALGVLLALDGAFDEDPG